MQAVSEERGDRLKISISGRFDGEGAKVVAGALEHALNTGWHSVELDMDGVEYLSSAGMRVLIIYHRKFSRLQGTFYLTSLHEKIGRILEMTGLYSLLEAGPDPGGQEAPGQDRIAFDGWAITVSEPEPGVTLLPQVIGSPGRCTGASPDESGPVILPFPPAILAIGTGALGYEAADCPGHYGPFLAAGGYVAVQPPQDDRNPDYVEYAEADIPRLHVLDAISLAGGYSHHISFGSDKRPPGPGELLRAILSAGNTTAAGFVLAAECERPAEDPLPGEPDEGGGNLPARNADRDGGTLCLMLAGGVAGGEGMPGLLREKIFPGSAGTDLSWHAHAAFFSYQPLRRRGPVKPGETLAFMFDQDLREVVHLPSPGNRPGEGGIRLLRGLVWFAPVREPDR